jgi:uncharacterized protein YqgC (DUF456 family)
LSLLLQSFTFGLIVVFIILGIIGIIVPLLPGIILIYMAVLTYVWAYGMETLGWVSFIIITLIALVTGTSDLWMSLLGAKSGGASGRSLLYGTVGAIVGSFFAPLIGTLIGYAVGLLLGEYQRHGDWAVAWKASAGGLAGWGVATAVQLAGGLIILAIFLWQVLFST